MTDKTRVLHVITGLATGGAERALYNLLHGGLAEKFECHVISLGDQGTVGPKIRELGVPVTALDMPGGRPTLSGLNKLRKTAREFRPDLIQGWMYHGNLAATVARILARGRAALAWNVRQSLYDLAHEKRMTRQIIRGNRAFSSRVDALLYNSQLSRSQHEAFGFAAGKGRVIPNGIDVRRFSASSTARQRVRSELGIGNESLLVGHVARLHPMKDHSTFLRAAADLCGQHSGVNFMLVGKDVSLKNSMLADLVPDWARDRFHFLGERDDVSELMSCMDIFCQSSWAEAFPNVLGEAMAIGLPCIATDVGDSAIILGETGSVVPPRDAAALGAGIGELLKLSGTERRSLGARARARVEENYVLEAIVGQYATLYTQLSSARRAD